MNPVKEHEDYMQRWRAGGRRTAEYDCPSCHTSIECPAPDDPDECWDSLIKCPYCGDLHMHVVNAKGAQGLKPAGGAA